MTSSLFTTTAPVQYWPGLIEAYRRYFPVSEHIPIVTLHAEQKTAAFEVVDALEDAPDWLCIPVGNAGNISSYGIGFCQSWKKRSPFDSPVQFHLMTKDNLLNSTKASLQP